MTEKTLTTNDDTLLTLCHALPKEIADFKADLTERRQALVLQTFNEFKDLERYLTSLGTIYSELAELLQQLITGEAGIVQLQSKMSSIVQLKRTLESASILDDALKPIVAEALSVLTQQSQYWMEALEALEAICIEVQAGEVVDFHLSLQQADSQRLEQVIEAYVQNKIALDEDEKPLNPWLKLFLWCLFILFVYSLIQNTAATLLFFALLWGIWFIYKVIGWILTDLFCLRK